MKSAGGALLLAIVVVSVAAPWLAPNPPGRQFDTYLYAPPTPFHWTSFSPLRLVNRLERRFEVRERPGSVCWFGGGDLGLSADANEPLLLLGADSYGRDIFARLLYGSRASLGLAALATLVTMIFGAVIGGIAGYAGGAVDELLSRFSDFVLVLPAIYVVLALRAVMPLVLPSSTVFLVLTAIFALMGWPIVARGVRAIIASERERDYAIAGVALGAGPARLLLLHLLPAARGYLAVQATLLLPAFILAEATLSYVGLGFPATVPTWG